MYSRQEIYNDALNTIEYSLDSTYKTSQIFSVLWNELQASCWVQFLCAHWCCATHWWFGSGFLHLNFTAKFYPNSTGFYRILTVSWFWCGSKSPQSWLRRITKTSRWCHSPLRWGGMAWHHWPCLNGTPRFVLVPCFENPMVARKPSL